MLKYLYFIAASFCIVSHPILALEAGCSDDIVRFYDYKTARWGYRDSSNSVIVIPPQYEAAEPFCSGLAAVKKQSAWGYINKLNEKKIPFIYDAVRSFSKNNTATVKRNGLWELLSKDGTNLCNRKFMYMAPESEGLIASRFLKDEPKEEPNKEIDVKSTYLDQDCSMIGGALGDLVDATSFLRGLAAVKRKHTWHLVDREFQNVLTEPLYTRPRLLRPEKGNTLTVAPFSKYIHLTRKNPVSGNIEAALYDVTEKKLTDWFDDIAPLSDSLAVVQVLTNGVRRYGYFELVKGTWITRPIFEDASGSPELYYGVKSNGHYGFLNANFQWVIPASFIGIARHFHKAYLSSGSEDYFAEVYERTGRGSLDCRRVRISPSGNGYAVLENFVPCSEAEGIQERSGFLRYVVWE